MLFSHYQKACLVLFTERQLYSIQLDIVGHVTLIRLIHGNEIYDITLQQNLILEYAFFFVDCWSFSILFKKQLRMLTT